MRPSRASCLRSLFCGVCVLLLSSGRPARTQPAGSQPAGRAPSDYPSAAAEDRARGKSDRAVFGGAANAPVAVMQLKKEIQGEFEFRFVARNDDTLGPAPLPAPGGSEGVIALPVPASVLRAHGSLEIIDIGRGNVARLPADTKGVASLNEACFKWVQSVVVPVQARGQGVYGIQVTLESSDRKFRQTALLKQADAGQARFTNVPLGEPVTVTVRYGANPPKSQTETLTYAHAADGYRWQTIEIDWKDVRTIAPPPAAAASPSAVAGKTESAPRERPDTSPAQNSGGVWNSLAGTAVSLLFLGAIFYGLYWSVTTGRARELLIRLGISVDSPQTATASSPFSRPEPPIPSILDGTADPLAGSSPLSSQAAVQPLADGPRLIGTVGTYSGQVFPIAGSAVDIGRDANNPIALAQDTQASRRHATIMLANGQYQVVDHGSSNGTYVNGVRIAGPAPQPLRPGDELQIGMTRFRFES